MYCLARGRKYMMYLVITSFVFQSAWVLLIDDTDINCSLVTCTVFVIKHFFKGGKFTVPRFGRKGLMYGFYTIVITIIAPMVFSGLVIMYQSPGSYNFGYFDSIVLSPSISFLTQPLAVVLYALTAVVMYNNRHLIEWDDFERYFYRLFLFVFIVGLSHFVLANLGLPYGILRELFHNEYITLGSTMFDKKGYGDAFLKFMSTFSEASYCGGFLAMSLLFFLCSERKNKWTYIVLTIIALLLNQSSTGMVSSAIGLFVYLYVRLIHGKINKKMFSFFILTLLCGIVFIAINSTFREIIYNITFNKINSGSYENRNINNLFCIDVFIKTYGIGVGVNTTKPYSLAVALLSQVGVIGTLLYVAFMKQVFSDIKRKLASPVRVQVFYLIGCALVASLLSCSAFNLSFFWQAMVIFAISLPINESVPVISLEDEFYEKNTSNEY